MKSKCKGNDYWIDQGDSFDPPNFIFTNKDGSSKSVSLASMQLRTSDRSTLIHTFGLTIQGAGNNEVVTTELLKATTQSFPVGIHTWAIDVTFSDNKSREIYGRFEVTPDNSF